MIAVIDWPVAALIMTCVISASTTIIIAFIQWRPSRGDKNSEKSNESKHTQFHLSPAEIEKRRKEIDRVIWSAEQLEKDVNELRTWMKEIETRSLKCHEENIQSHATNLDFLRQLEERNNKWYESIDKVMRELLNVNLKT